MKRLNIQLSKIVLAAIVSFGSLATAFTFGNINRAVADEYMGENSSMSQEMSAQDSIVSQLSASGSFNTLAKAVEAAGLVEELQTSGEYTVFAPTDEAFEALPPGTLEALLQPENKEILQQILKYHIVLGAANSSEISSGLFETAAGSGVEIDVANSMVQVGNAQVIQPDIQASNGVIHGINQVMLPPDISVNELQALSAY
jgi:uncharacterized surface protein with fasciclin (FAS1) repeats